MSHRLLVGRCPPVGYIIRIDLANCMEELSTRPQDVLGPKPLFEAVVDVSGDVVQDTCHHEAKRSHALLIMSTRSMVLYLHLPNGDLDTPPLAELAAQPLQIAIINVHVGLV